MAKKERTRVVRLDGKPINVVRKRCHLLVCAKGCCCGRTERGHAAVPIDFYKQEYKRRKLRNRIQLSMNGCLGPCALANVVLLFFDGRPIWLQSINSNGQISAIYDYIEAMLAADRYLPAPAELAEYVFSYYTWSGPTPDDSAGRGELRKQPVSLATASSGILFLTHADTDLLALHRARESLPAEAPPVHAQSLNRITNPEHMAALLDEHGPSARVIVVRLLGGIESVPGFRRLADLARQEGRHFLVLSGTGEPDAELAALSTVPPALAQQAASYLQMGGLVNMGQLLRLLSDNLLMTGLGYEPPQPQPSHGIYARRSKKRHLAAPTIGILFYRSHWMSGNLAFIDALAEDLERRGANVVPVFANSLKELGRAEGPGGRPWPAAFEYFLDSGKPTIDALICTMSFAMGEVNAGGSAGGGWSADALAALDVPVIQAICCSSARWQWQASPRGLNPLDTAMNVALPEFDGRIVTVPISFKEILEPEAQARDAPALLTCASGSTGSLPTKTQAVHYRPDAERIAHVSGLALRLAELRRKPNHAKKVAIILTNAAGKAARVGNAVGLDAPASLVRILQAMREAGYQIADFPTDSDALIHELIERCSYDETYLTEEQLARAAAHVSSGQYERWFAELPESQRKQMAAQWGPPPGEAYVHNDAIALAGLDLGHAFIALQPPRGYGMDANAIYHRPDLPPPHNYYALYRWLRDVWRADAIVHLGKHGTLEWLPGKSVGLSAECFPDTFLGDLPLFYPFIVNDPGEGAQAKRRTHAVIIDHLMPPLTTADAHGELAELMQLVDEYYQVEMLDPVKMPLLQRQIWDLIQKANLQDDLKFLMQENHGDHTHSWDDTLTADGTPIGLAQMRGREIAHVIQDLDGYLCELAGAQIRDGLHILGQALGEQLVGTVQALTRLPNLDVPSLRQALGRYLGADPDALQKCRGDRLEGVPARLTRLASRPLVTHGDALDLIDELCGHLLASLERHRFAADRIPQVVAETLLEPDGVEQRSENNFPDSQDRGSPLSPGTPGERGWGEGERQDQCKSFTSLQGILPPSPPTPLPRSTVGEGSQSPSPRSKSGSYCSTIPEQRDLRDALTFVCRQLVPTLSKTTDEIGNLLAGLDGRYVPAGPSGAPTRGMAHVLPTGRNFYTVDPRALPSQASWEVGQQLAREVLDRYRKDTSRSGLPNRTWSVQDHRSSPMAEGPARQAGPTGYPETVGISIWGTSAMRTGGDDVAEVLALLGVKPVWQKESRRTIGIDVISLAELGRPRIDVVVRISGFFRDAFPHLIKLLDEAVLRVSELDEPIEMNFVRKHYLAEIASHEPAAPARDLHRRARYRIFGSPPGCYGAGLLPLIDERNWDSTADLAETYINWGGYAYVGHEEGEENQKQGIDARDEFRTRLGQIQVALHNQDNREHDIFDSDDYFQFHGGMIASIRALTGRRPHHYFGDSQDPAHAQVRDLKQEVLRVFRTRVVNPKWLAGIQRHGYKGGLELAATVDYLFGFDATAEVIDDWMYEEVAKSYALDPAIQEFLRQSNPWAMRAIGERLLEAAERGMWAEPSPEILDALRQQLFDAESVLEAHGEVDSSGQLSEPRP